MSASIPSADVVLQRMVNAVEQVRQRLLRASAALRSAKVDYAVVGGNAVAAWVATVDEAAVRNTRDVDILLRRTDFEAAKAALESAGFVYRHASGLDMFLDGSDAKARDAVHVVFANEAVKPDQAEVNPDVSEYFDMGAFRVVSLEALVRNKLTAFRDKDRTHIRDMLSVGLIDESWVRRYSALLAARLQSLIDTPDG